MYCRHEKRCDPAILDRGQILGELWTFLPKTTPRLDEFWNLWILARQYPQIKISYLVILFIVDRVRVIHK